MPDVDAPSGGGTGPVAEEGTPGASPAVIRGRAMVRRLWVAGQSIAMTCGLGMVLLDLAATRQAALAGQSAVPGVRLGGHDVGGLDRTALRAVAQQNGQQTLDRPLTLVAGETQIERTARALGAQPVAEASVHQALGVGRSGDLWVDLRDRVRAARGQIDLAIGYRFVDGPALDELLALAPEVDRPSLPTRLDLEQRKVLAAQAGSALLAYDSLSSVALGLAEGADRIELVVQDKPPVEDPLASLAHTLELGVVLGSFDTPYRTDDGDRTHNLKLGATAIDGTVLMPGDVFSFNDIVGPRSADAGYRYATGIAGGELVDTMGGGICQVSSTLFGAGFFAGLEIVRASPHSRPSSYVDMGLDSTVVYPNVDMKLRNGFEFPVVLHMTVRQGKVQAEVLGPQRPYQVVFERTVDEMLPFETVWRPDTRLHTGVEAVAQRGLRGFRLTRTRTLYRGAEVVSTQDWSLTYPPTRQIVRRGTNPAGHEAPEPKPEVTRRDPAPTLRIVQ